MANGYVVLAWQRRSTARPRVGFTRKDVGRAQRGCARMGTPSPLVGWEVAEPLSILVCQFLWQEANAALPPDLAGQVTLRVLPCDCALGAEESPAQEQGTFCLLGPGPSVALGCAAAVGRVRVSGQTGCHLHPLSSCLELLLDPRTLNHLVHQGALLVTPEWLRQWRHHLECCRFKQQGLHESASHVVLLDAGLEEAARGWLQDLARHLDLPAKILPVGLTLLRLTLRNLHLQHALHLAHGTRDTNACTNPASPELASMVGRLFVPSLADVCLLDVVEGPNVVRLPAGWVDPAPQSVLQEVANGSARAWSTTDAIHQVLRTGQPLLATDAVEWISSGTPAEQRARQQVFGALSARSVMVLPLEARGRALGAVTLISTQPERCYTQQMLAQAQPLGQTSALVLDHAHLSLETSRANRNRTAVFSAISHDLKSPLSAISLTAQRLARVALKMDGAEGARLALDLSTLDERARRMNHMLDEILDFTRMQSGQPPELVLQPTSVETLVQHVVSEEQQTTQRHLLNLVCKEGDLEILVDQARMERALSNLVSNAVKYSPHGGRILVTVERVGPCAQVSVRDWGLGIPPEDLPNIFQPFRRGRNVGGVAGTGMGLASVQLIVEQHGGTLLVESQPGQGTCFSIRLPLHSTVAATNPLPSEPAIPTPTATPRGSPVQSSSTG